MQTYQTQINAVDQNGWTQVQAETIEEAAIETLRGQPEPSSLLPCTIYVGDPRPTLQHNNGTPMVVHALKLAHATSHFTQHKYEALQSCINAGDHLQDVDRDGFCNCCGFQEQATELFPEGTRVRLKVDIERYPHFVAEAGRTGVVAISDAHLFAVTMDEPLAGSEAWDNQICWAVDDGDYSFTTQLEAY